MIKIILPILLLCMLACLYIAAPYDNTSNDETITISTLDEGGVQTTLQSENIPYHYNATQNTRNFYFVEVFVQTKSTTPLREILQYAPCNRVSEYVVMGMDMSKSSDELEEYSYIPSLTEENTAYSDKKDIGHIKFSPDGCNYNILNGTEEDCLDIISRFSAFPSLEEVNVRYSDGKPQSINVIFTREKYTYFLGSSFAEDLDGFAAMLTAMQKEPPDDNDFTRSLIEFMDEQCLVPILLPSGYGPFTNALG